MWLLILLCLPYLSAGQIDIVNDYDTDLFSYYVTRPDIEAPKWSIQTYDAQALQHGLYWFVAPYLKLEQDTFPMWNGPYIYRTDGELIWSGGSFFYYHNIHDFRVSEVKGRKMLSLILSHATNRSAQLYDETYTEYKALDISSGYEHPNMHDFNLIDGGKRALALLHQPVSVVRVPGTSNGTCHVKWDGFMEVDTATNEILFEWKAQSHLALNESDLPPQAGAKKTLAEVCSHQGHIWDLQHVNSIDKFEDGDYLLSARNADALYKISHKDHSIVWRLGGLKSDFVMGPGARFERQHHARVRGENTTHVLISLFNNAQSHGFLASEAITNHTAGLLLALRLDVHPMTAEVVTHFDKPLWHGDIELKKKTRTRGSMQMLPNGNAFLGWVNHCHISEHAPDGTLLQQAAVLAEDVNTYRSYKMAWVGRPSDPPDVVARLVRKHKRRPLHTQVYVSWNGATEVASWKVLSVSSWLPFSSTVLASQNSTGFETMITLDGYVERVVVAGLDADGQELGRSSAIKTADPDKLKPSSPKTDWSPIVGAIAGGLTASLFFLTIMFRKPLLECVARAKRIAFRPSGGAGAGEDDGLLAAAVQEEEQLQLFPEEDMVEEEEYKDSRLSMGSGDKVG